MSKETIVSSAFRVHRSKFSCSLAAALLDGLFEHPAGVSSCCATRHVHPSFEMCVHYMPERRNGLGVDGSESLAGSRSVT
jgi:hypothetical protein